jgi:hypothetical protein
VSQFASQSPPTRQTNLSSSSQLNFAHPRSPGRYSASSEHQYTPQSMFSDTARDRGHAFDINTGQRSVTYREEERGRERLSSPARADPVPKQSPKRIETLRESLARDKTKPGLLLGPHGDQAHTRTKECYSEQQRRRFRAKLVGDLQEMKKSIHQRGYIEALERGELPILSPNLRFMHLLPAKPAWTTRPPSPPQRKPNNNSGKSQSNGKIPPTGPRYLREKQNAKFAAQNLRIEISDSTSAAKNNGKPTVRA